tara:strand:+ start:207 stop:884 length:678 start_codon:yes stop_codon:yes gene_type:complete
MKIIIFLFFIFLLSLSTNAQCEPITLRQEFELTQNIAIVKGHELKKDSIIVEVLKKWKGDSIGKFVTFKTQEFNTKYFKLDTGRFYILFWFNGLSIDRCSRSSDFRYAHFESELDRMYNKYVVKNVLLYDSILYKKNYIFEAGGQKFDIQKGQYAFYDIQTSSLKSFKDLPKDLSFRKKRKFYIIDKNIETAKHKFDVVFALIVDRKELQITKSLKKKVLSSLYQ